jgi:hypothetical protein
MCSWLFSCQPAHALPGRSEVGGMPPETGGPGFTFVPFGQERRRDGIVLRNPAGAFVAGARPSSAGRSVDFTSRVPRLISLMRQCARVGLTQETERQRVVGSAPLTSRRSFWPIRRSYSASGAP